jgi:hypothetical protein
MRMMKPLCKGVVSAYVFALPFMVQAAEGDVYCELSAAQAESEARVLATPSAFVNVGDPSISSRIVSAGISKSLSQSRRAGLTRELAAAECDVYRSSVAIKNSVESIPDRIEQLSLRTRIAGYERATVQAERNLATEKALLGAQEATLSEYTVAQELRDRTALGLAAMHQRASELAGTVDPSTQAVSALITENTSAQARAASLAARIKSARGWDVNVLVGYRHDFGSGSQSPFVGMTATYSFGYSGASAASDRVGELTTKLLTEQRDGGLQRLQRLRQMLHGSLAAESLRKQSLEERSTAIHMQLERVGSLDTQAAKRVRRNMAVEQLITRTELEASAERIREINAWLSKDSRFQ